MSGTIRSRIDAGVAAVLLALAVAVAIYAAWAFGEVHRAVEEAVDAGQLVVAGSEFDIAGFYMSSSGQFVVFAAVLAALGWSLVQRHGVADDSYAALPASGTPPAAPAVGEDDLDDLLDTAFDQPDGDRAS